MKKALILTALLLTFPSTSFALTLTSNSPPTKANSLAQNLDPNDAQAYVKRGYAYYELKEYQKAIADFTQAINIAPNVASIYGLRGIVYSELEEYQKAIADFDKAINLDSTFATSYLMRGLAYGLQREFQKALVDAEQAAKLFREQGNEEDYQKAQDLINLIKQEMNK